ncbi:MAG: phosphate/phosphite/phosphonate ABC transporter substrate-binding protein [Nitrospiraceae bacterium]|nr:MAG: phosphate/phosphite/phosphonate ABC transporter substrate-binding protein [Nitrospiraceae bacterium]
MFPELSSSFSAGITIRKNNRNNNIKNADMGHRYLFITLFLVVFFSEGVLHAAELTIGLIPEQNVFKQFKRYEPLGKYIEKRTGIKIRFSALSRYGNIVESFSEEKMDGAFWGSFTGALAITKLGIEPVARPVNFTGASTYSGYIFVRKDSGITDVESMKDSVFAFVDKATSAGYIFPVAYLKEHGVNDIDGYFKEHYFTGSHDAAVYAVLNGEAHIGCAKNTVIDFLAKEDRRVKDDLVVLAKSPDFPSNTLGLRRDLPQDVKKKLRQVLIDMNKDPEGREVLRDFGAVRFIESTRADYDPVFKVSEKAGIDLRNYTYKNR